MGMTNENTRKITKLCKLWQNYGNDIRKQKNNDKTI